jgi:hypothetical protein
MAHWRGGLGAHEGRSVVVGPLRAVYVQLPQEFQGTVSSNAVGIRIQRGYIVRWDEQYQCFSSVFGRVDCYVVCLRGVHVHLLQIEILFQTTAFIFQRLKYCRF